MLRSLIGLLSILLSATASTAHEFWISPNDYQVETGNSIQIRLHNGQEFSGPETAYFPTFLNRFELLNAAGTDLLGVFPGDRPAASVAMQIEGLNTVIYESKNGSLDYDEQAKFDKFVAHKDLAADIANSIYADRQVPFKETYQRHAKSLIGVGSAQGQDQIVGLKHELVALDNPYLVQGDSISVKLFYDGQPRGDAQIELFEQTPAGFVNVSLHRTDANGIVRLPVKSGHIYLVDAVKIIPLPAETADDPIWHTQWASLTFMRP